MHHLITPAEQDRLAALDALHVLDTPAEQRFDRLTRLAALTFGVPIALVSLVDGQRQWFKSRCGLDVPETPRSIAFCSHAVAQDELLVVEDALLDPRFAANPLVTGAPHVRFYAGHPLRSGGQPVGTLCIIDHAPRTLTQAERQALRDLADLAEAELNHVKVAAAHLLAEQALKALNTDLERRVAERTAELELNERRLRTITDNVPVLIAHLDSGRRYVFANAVHQSWLGKPADQILGKTMEEAFGSDYLAPQAAALEQAWRGQASQCEHEIVRKKHTRIAHTTFLPQLHEGAVTGVFVLTTDSTASRMHERSLHALAHTDTLTGLPNRRHFETALRSARRGADAGRGGALLYLDIDHFKRINDRYGHAVGDAVLVEFARRLRGAVRSDDLVSRLSGDEFTVLLNDIAGEADLEVVARKVLDAMRPPFILDTLVLQVGTSIGAALADQPDLAPARLVDAADRALYRAKEAGRNTWAMLRLERGQAPAPAPHARALHAPAPSHAPEPAHG